MKSFYIAALAISAVFAACAPVPTSNTPASDGGEVAAPAIDDLNVPVARPLPNGGQANKVISPYRPYNVIDVSGYKSGDIVGDPSTASVGSDGKIIANTAKQFRIP